MESSIKLRVLPELSGAAQMSVHVMDEMSRAAVTGVYNSSAHDQPHKL